MSQKINDNKTILKKKKKLGIFRLQSPTKYRFPDFSSKHSLNSFAEIDLRGMSTIKWKSWCRLCARVDGGTELKVDSIKILSNLLQKYLHISISSSDDCLSVVCQECLDLVFNVEKFVLRCAKVNKMYLELLNGSINDDAIESIHETYGLSGSYEYINCEISQLEAKPEPISDSESIETYAKNEVSCNDEDGSDNDTALSIPDCKRRKIDPETCRQTKPKNRKQNAETKSTRQTAKDRKKCELKPKSLKRKPVRGTDVWCHLCDTTFSLPRRYMAHMRNRHSPNVLPFTCDQCPKFFVSENKMLQHATCHRPAEQKKIHPCPECDRTFTRAETVQLHIRIVHMGERPFVCEECGKACATKAALKEHQVSHSDLRPFKCSDCPKCFKDLPSLKRHKGTHNTTSFECLQCGQRLNTLHTLRNHMLVHSDEKRYKCQHCGNEYKRYKALKNHLILHSGMRPYVCPFCNVSYADGSNLRAHKKKYHPIELATIEAAGKVTLAFDK